MSYQTGTALHQDDLVDKLRIFALADGWTVNKFVAGSGNGFSSELYLQKGSEAILTIDSTFVGGNNVYHGGLTSPRDKPTLEIYGATGFDGGLAVDDQPGTTWEPTASPWIVHGIVNYRFFSDGGVLPYIHVVVETTPLEFVHFGFGVVIKAGAYDGGMYAYGTDHRQASGEYFDADDAQHAYALAKNQGSGSNRKVDFIRVNIESSQWKYFSGISQPDTFSNAVGVHSAFVTSNGAILDGFVYDNSGGDRGSTPSEFNGVAPLFTMPAIIERQGITIVGCFADIRFTSLRNHSPGDTVILGGDTWHLFPMSKRGDPWFNRTPNIDGNSGWAGFAYKEIT